MDTSRREKRARTGKMWYLKGHRSRVSPRYYYLAFDTKIERDNAIEACNGYDYDCQIVRRADVRKELGKNYRVYMHCCYTDNLNLIGALLLYRDVYGAVCTAEITREIIRLATEAKLAATEKESEGNKNESN